MIALSTRLLRGKGEDAREALAAASRAGFPEWLWNPRDLEPGRGIDPGLFSRTGIRVVGLAPFDGEGAPLRDPGSDGLASSDSGASREAAGALIRRAAEARALGASVVLLRLGALDVTSREERDALARKGEAASAEAARSLREDARSRAEKGLESACRTLFEVCRAAPSVSFCVENPSLGYELGWPEDFRKLFAEVRAPNLGCWFASGSARVLHDAGLGPEPGELLETVASRLIGASLSDVERGIEGLLPGRGAVDFRMIAFYLPRRARRVLALAPGPSFGDVRESVEFLRGRGIL